MSTAPTLIWIRRELRLADHPALAKAVAHGGPVIVVYVRDVITDGLGAAPKWRLGEGLRAFGDALERAGSKLILRTGAPAHVLGALAQQTGANAVYWTRSYDPASVAAEKAVKAALDAMGITAKRFGGHLMHEPESAETKTGGFYKVYTPFWKNVKTRDVTAPLGASSALAAPEIWPASEALEDWQLGAAMNRGAGVVAAHARVGEAAALDRLAEFTEQWIADYVANRDKPAVPGTSGLSQNLALGEISPRTCWHAGMRALHEGKAGAEVFLKELVWREFAYHLMHHTPHILSGNWKPDWDAFPWNRDEDHPNVIAWKQGRTGIPFVDAAMREMYVTGTMHNRGRMIVASYLTKHLMSHWQIGLKWFEDCLIDWDPASNAMGWQWSAGSGPDASPYFRVFNPVSQLEKFDKMGRYPGLWIAEGQAAPPPAALSYFEAVPRSWGLSASDRYPAPIVSPADGRTRALDAYQNRST